MSHVKAGLVAATVLCVSPSYLDAASVSFAAGLASGGVELTIGGQSVTMTTTPLALGSGQIGPNHMNTGPGEPLGGTFDGSYFAAPAFPGGAAGDATRINIGDASTVLNGESTDFANAVGFRVDFSQSIRLDHFYHIDIDGQDANVGEWGTAFALNGSQIVVPTFSFSAPTNLLLLEDEAISASWGTDLGTPVPSTLDVARIRRTAYSGAGAGGALPGDADHQTLLNFDGQSATTLFFFMGGVSRVGTGGQNSGVSALHFDDTSLGVQPVPLPYSALLLGVGLLVLSRSRNQQRAAPSP